MPETPAMDNLSHEDRSFPPGPEFVKNAVAHEDLYERAQQDRLGYWAERSREALTWAEDFTTVLNDSEAPFYKWFEDGKLNAAYNALDRHVEAGNGDRVAIYFEDETGATATYTYAELTTAVKKAANAFSELGVGSGDRIAMYMPMIPEAVITMLASARLGAIHSVVFAGFSADALRSRVDDAEAKLVVTADGNWRRGKPNPVKKVVDAALEADGHTVSNVVVVRNNKEEPEAWVEGRDLWWHDIMEKASDEHTAEAFEAEHPLFILYTSGTTGKPKGILHTTGGYLTQAAVTAKDTFDLHPETDVYWCTADIGWITGHSYVTYGPLINGATILMYDGTMDTPDKGRWWDLVEKYKVTIMYTAPTAIRTAMKWGRDIPDARDLSSLRVLGSVGEPINPEAWMWYREVIGANNGAGKDGQPGPRKEFPAPIVDTWWQTETGAHMIAPLPGVTATKPGSAQVAVPGISADVVDDLGEPLGNGEAGLLVIKEPWPAMLRGIWNDPERYKDTYWDRFGDMYFAGDGAKKDDDGDLWLMGRVDDVMNVSGHRLSTTEIESSLVAHEAVAEAAVVGAADETKGEAVVAFVILSGEAGSWPEDITEQLRQHVAADIGAIARPKAVFAVPELPKTRSGKIMRRLLKDVAEGRPAGDSSTLADTTVMNQISESMRNKG